MLRKLIAASKERRYGGLISAIKINPPGSQEILKRLAEAKERMGKKHIYFRRNNYEY